MDKYGPTLNFFKIIFIGFLASLFGFGRQAASSAPAPSPAKDISTIDLTHESEGVFYHGTLTLINGTVGATWTVDDGKGKTGYLGK